MGLDEISVGLIDDEPLFTAGLAMILNAQADMHAVWQAVDGDESLSKQAANPADVLLVDVQMPRMDGITATKKLVETDRSVRVIILTTYDTDDYIPAAIDAGASGFLLKNTPPERLVEAIRSVYRGEAIISPGPTKKLFRQIRNRLDSKESEPILTADDRRSLGALTGRESQVLMLVARGLTNQEICDELWISMPTVKTHIGNLLAKTQARDRVQLVLFALRTHFIDIQDVLTRPQPGSC